MYKGGDVTVGYAAANQQPAQLKEVLPHYAETNHAVWPVIILYPQYGQLDVIEGIFLDLLYPFSHAFFRTSLCVLCTHIESRLYKPHVVILLN
jgi:hypothetical protein